MATDGFAALTVWDAGGLVGVALTLAAYGLTVADRLDAKGVPALPLNLAGAPLVLMSLAQAFNLSAAVIEAAWALIAPAGLLRHAFMRMGRRGSKPAGTESPGRGLASGVAAPAPPTLMKRSGTTWRSSSQAP